MGKLYKAEDLMSVLGVYTDTINYWKRRGYIPKPRIKRHGNTNRCFWTESDVEEMRRMKERESETLTIHDIPAFFDIKKSKIETRTRQGLMPEPEIIFGKKRWSKESIILFMESENKRKEKLKKEKLKAKPKRERKPKQGKNNAKLSKKPQEKTQKVVNKEEMADVTGDNPKRIISIGEMMKLTSKGRSTIVRWSENGTLPKPLRKPNGHILGWTVEQYQEFLKSCGGE